MSLEGVEQEFAGLRREAKGLVREYVAKTMGLSRAQMTRLIGQSALRSCVKWH